MAKVKEIKKALECCVDSIKYSCEGCPYHKSSSDCQELLIWDMQTYINELESENERLSFYKTVFDKGVCTELVNMQETIDKQEDRIAELEEYIKGNEQDAKAFVNGWHKDLETELKQFAERLRCKISEFDGLYQSCADVSYSDLIKQTIDETLKEFIDAQNSEH